MVEHRAVEATADASREASVDAIFGALADPTRRRLLQRLDAGPAAVSVLAEPFDVTLTSIAQHLRVLEDAGLIRTEKVGRQRVCAAEPAALAKAQSWIETRQAGWRGRLDRLAANLDHNDSHSGGQE